MSLSATKQPTPRLSLQPLSSVIGRGVTVGVAATLVQLLLLVLVLDLCGVFTLF